MRKTFRTILACGLLAMALCSCGSSNNPEGVAEVASKAIVSGDYDGLVDHLYIPDGTSDEQEKQMKETTSAMLKLKVGGKESEFTDYKIVKSDVNEQGTRAKVEVEFTKKDGTTKTQKLTIRKGKDDKWGLDL